MTPEFLNYLRAKLRAFHCFLVSIFCGDLEVLILTQCRRYCTAQRGAEFEHAVAGAAANSKVRLMALAC